MAVWLLRHWPCGGGSRPSDGPAFCQGLGVGPRLRWPQAKPLASPRRRTRLGQSGEEAEPGFPSTGSPSRGPAAQRRAVPPRSGGRAQAVCRVFSRGGCADSPRYLAVLQAA